jgi:hypothetical protein
MIIKEEDIRGYRIEKEIVCKDCVEQEELVDLINDQIITNDEIEHSSSHYFCDRCSMEI